jgi:hypothetical protein
MHALILLLLLPNCPMLVSVCFERGGKISSSHDRSVAFLEDGTIELFCHESLSLVATIYKDSNGTSLVSVSESIFIIS